MLEVLLRISLLAIFLDNIEEKSLCSSPIRGTPLPRSPAIPAHFAKRAGLYLVSLTSEMQALRLSFHGTLLTVLPTPLSGIDRRG